MKTIYLAAGCFWGAQKYFDYLTGVKYTEVGYANGNIDDPTYPVVKKGDTGFAETVKVDYDPEQITLEEIVTLFFEAIDPTTLNRQAHDIGTQYRSGVYYVDEADEPIIAAVRDKVQKQYEDDVVTEILPLSNFYSAEEYHQKYLDKNPTGYCHISNASYERIKNYKKK
ncbi:MAG: peptide-methionine (S)-S-oxide reductase MsrA [Erysipelotrichaceae bacterium]|jgi:peptide methionine sulfoxide reductase msrA/msrB|nr:peptide-methionine (S)-S-oxide reductase MsrA [Erysipelotrichaceae bacterium]